MINQTAQVVFSDSGFSIPVEQRPLWRLSVICCSIQLVGKPEYGLSLNKTRILCWMAIRKHLWPQYLNYLLYQRGEKPRISIDKSTDRAIELGLEKELFSLDCGKLSIAKNGSSLLSVIEENGLFLDEKEFFLSIKTKLTEKMIKSIV